MALQRRHCCGNAQLILLVWRRFSRYKFNEWQLIIIYVPVLFTELYTTLYLSDTSSRVADISSRSRLRPSTSSQLMVRPSRLITVGERSLTSAGPTLWNISRTTSRPPRHCQTFVVNLKQIFFGNHIRTLSGSFSRHGGPWGCFLRQFVSDIAIFIMKRDVKLQLTN